MPKPVIVVHYHELWLKGQQPQFFLGKVPAGAAPHAGAISRSRRIRQPGDRVVIHLAEDTPVEPVVAALERVWASPTSPWPASSDAARDDDLDALCRAAWAEVEPLAFSNFRRARQAQRQVLSRTHLRRSKPHVGRYLLDHLRAAGRDVRVKLDDPELTCRIEITPGPMLVYARKIPGPGGLPANTTGRMLCLLSGGFDSAVAAYKMMRRGAHVSFVHFWGGGARPGESSVHVARALVERLVPYQFTAKLYLVPFEADPAGDRARRAGKLSPAALSPHDAADRRAHRAPRNRRWPSSPATASARWPRKRCKTWWPWARHRPCRFSGRWPATTSRRSWPSRGASARSRFPPSRFTIAAASCCRAVRRCTPRAEIWIRPKRDWMFRSWSIWG